MTTPPIYSFEQYQDLAKETQRVISLVDRVNTIMSLRRSVTDKLRRAVSQTSLYLQETKELFITGVSIEHPDKIEKFILFVDGLPTSKTSDSPPTFLTEEIPRKITCMGPNAANQVPFTKDELSTIFSLFGQIHTWLSDTAPILTENRQWRETLVNDLTALANTMISARLIMEIVAAEVELLSLEGKA